uniref:Uncharacterized protein n=1 Tax=Lotharella oceanica TaxID=641309 RepID=A0A7S2X9P2_9EUKA|mmetsp:Transcript_19320/g.36366  ORF Transcript_19320/g.36366 Transcript_19320/m.36366 type:complete len:350 (+) Transcript_19320:66-1115(+)
MVVIDVSHSATQHSSHWNSTGLGISGYGTVTTHLLGKKRARNAAPNATSSQATMHEQGYRSLDAGPIATQPGQPQRAERKHSWPKTAPRRNLRKGGHPSHPRPSEEEGGACSIGSGPFNLDELLAPPRKAARSLSHDDSRFHFTVIERHPRTQRTRIKVGRDVPLFPPARAHASATAGLDGSSSSPSPSPNNRPTILSILQMHSHRRPAEPRHSPLSSSPSTSSSTPRRIRSHVDKTIYRSRSETPPLAEEDGLPEDAAAAAGNGQESTRADTPSAPAWSHRPAKRPDALRGGAQGGGSSVTASISSLAWNTLTTLDATVSVTCCCLWTVAAYDAIDSLGVATESTAAA